MKITNGMIQQAKILKEQGVSWYMIGKIMLVSSDAIRRGCEPAYKKMRLKASKRSYLRHLETRRETMRKYIKRTYVPKNKDNV